MNMMNMCVCPSCTHYEFWDLDHSNSQLVAAIFIEASFRLHLA